MLDIILLEDEPVLREELTDFLGNCGYPVESIATLAEFRSCFDSTRHRIAIIDLGLPDGDGLDLIRELRANEQPPGIVVLSARKSTRDKVLGLGDGADYYLGKGTDLDELAATLAALNRRLEPSSATKPWVLETGPRRLHLPDGIRMPLSQQDFLVLHALMCESGELVSRQRIVAALGKDFLNYDQRCLDTQMRRLRRKIAAAGNLELPVKTARNAGYRFYAEARVVD